MRVVVNGKEQDLPAGATVAELIDRMGLGRQACAAEVNKGLVARREREMRELREGDVVEVVTLVGGG